MNFLLFNVIIHFIWIFFLMQTIIYASEDQCALSEIWPRLLAQIGYILINLTTGWAMKFTIIGILLITIVNGYVYNYDSNILHVILFILIETIKTVLKTYYDLSVNKN